MDPNTSVAFKAVFILGAALIAAVLGLTVGFVRGQALTQGGYLLALERADGAFYATRKGCESLDGEEWKLCIATALAQKSRAMAEAEVKLRNTSDAYRMQRVVAAGTLFLTEIQRCATASVSTRQACDDAALGAFREAMARASGRDSASGACTLLGCPNRSAPSLRTVQTGSRV